MRAGLTAGSILKLHSFQVQPDREQRVKFKGLQSKSVSGHGLEDDLKADPKHQCRHPLFASVPPLPSEVSWEVRA